MLKMPSHLWRYEGMSSRILLQPASTIFHPLCVLLFSAHLSHSYFYDGPDKNSVGAARANQRVGKRVMQSRSGHDQYANLLFHLWAVFLQKAINVTNYTTSPRKHAAFDTVNLGYLWETNGVNLPKLACAGGGKKELDLAAAKFEKEREALTSALATLSGLCLQGSTVFYWHSICWSTPYTRTLWQYPDEMAFACRRNIHHSGNNAI